MIGPNIKSHGFPQWQGPFINTEVINEPMIANEFTSQARAIGNFEQAVVDDEDGLGITLFKFKFSIDIQPYDLIFFDKYHVLPTHSCLDLTDQVRADVCGLGKDTATDSGE